MIGDRLDTDVMLGNNGNCTSILVFTGCTEKEDLQTAMTANTRNIRGIDLPTFYLSDVGRLIT
jgi:ribonucleotide monophosphatase NagD (HAD superfamily)